MKTSYDVRAINKQVVENPQQLIVQADEHYRNLLSNTVDDILNMPGVNLIMLAGPSGSGKTTTAKKLVEQFASRKITATVISLDDFFLDRGKSPKLPDGSDDFESVHALDLPLLKHCINELIAGRTAILPRFDFKVGMRSDETRELSLTDDDAVIIEGIHALNPIIHEGLTRDVVRMYLSVQTPFVDGSEVLIPVHDVRLMRRMLRDYRFRGSSPENTLRLWEMVRIGEEKYIYPYKDTASIQLDSCHAYEPGLFAGEILPLLSEVPQESVYYTKCMELSQALEQFELVLRRDVPRDSLLREFIGGSSYYNNKSDD